jgi:two-component system, chemotaxis family, CheB/CheR fusion protein
MAAVPEKDDFYIVGIGASAGGLQALRTLFSGMPPNPGYACVVVVHLAPDHESRLVELLQPYTQMPVQQVRKTVPLKPNHVYVIPPNANLNSIDTHLRLSELEARRVERATVDHFLRSLAATHDGRAVGVILTGAGSDGSLGIRLIKECGGLTIAQDPHEAEYDSMPLSAITTGTVDLVLPVREVPNEIARYCATRPKLPSQKHAGDVPPDDDLRLGEIIEGLQRITGHDFSVYRRPVLLRRIRHRMQLGEVDSLAEYARRVQTDAEEARALQRELQLHVSEFFQNPELYEALEHRLLPDLFARQPRRVRAWTIACTTGEEAYSLAMLLIEQSEFFQNPADLEVFATDISDDALQRARLGVYPREVAASVSPARLARFFEPEGGRYRVGASVRERVIFASHDLFKDPPYSHVNIIYCRNLLHELRPEMRKAVMNLFFFALEDDGVLVVGPKDQVDDPELFVADAHTPNIFHRRPGTRRQATASWLKLRPFARAATPAAGLLPAISSIDELFRSAAERYMPPTVLIDSAGDVVRFSSRAHRYIQIPGGDFTNSLSRLLPASIRFRLEAGLAQVEATGRAWASEEFVAELGATRRHLVLRIDPLGSAGTEQHLLVIFDERLPSIRPVQLEAEVARLGELLQGAGDAPNTREHVERLHLMVEQLEASREELRAVNEELTALDAENRGWISELAQNADDLRNILESTGVATVVLDARLRILRFMEPPTQLQLSHGDIGRRLREAYPALTFDEFEQEAERVIAHQTRVDREYRGSDDRWYLARMLPYRTSGRGVEGIIISFIDITERKRVEAALEVIEQQHRLTVQLVPAMLWWTDSTGQDVSVNQQWKVYTGQDDDDVDDLGWLDAVHPDEREEARAAFRHTYQAGEPLERQQRIRGADGEYRWHLIRHVPVRDENGAVTRWFGAAIDVHELRELQDRQQTLVAELHHRTRNLITVVRSLSDRTVDRADTLEDFAARFNLRLAALARAQSLLSHVSAGERVTFDKLLRTELAALGAGGDKVTLAGPEGVPLRAIMVQTLALAIHELATNSTKYGALSPNGGHLHIRWHVEPSATDRDPVLRVEWKESGVKMPEPLAQTRGGGYGRELIENALPYQHGAEVSFALEPDGVRCTIALAIPPGKSSRLASETHLSRISP